MTNTEEVVRLDELEDAMELYCIYKSMLINEKSKKRKIYDDWKNNFGAFYKWAVGNGFEKGLKLDIKDPRFGYIPCNIRFTHQNAMCNRTISRDKVFIKYDDDIKSATEWSHILGIPRTTIYDRRQRGWDDEEIIEGKRKAR